MIFLPVLLYSPSHLWLSSMSHIRLPSFKSSYQSCIDDYRKGLKVIQRENRKIDSGLANFKVKYQADVTEMVGKFEKEFFRGK